MNWKKNLGASKISSFIFFLILIFFVYRFLIFESTPHASKPVSQQPVKEISIVPTYATRAIDNSWPAISNEQTTLTMGKDTLTDNYYIVLDGSGSMEDSKCSGSMTKMQAASRALSDFVKNIPADANVGLAIFVKSQLFELAALQPAAQLNVDKLVADIKPTGSTPLYAAVKFAYQKLNEQGQKQLGYGRYHLIVITDGIASKNQDPTTIVNEMIDKSPINLHTIGFCIGTNHVLNQPGLLFYHAADNPQQLSTGLGSVLAESPSFDLSEFND